MNTGYLGSYSDDDGNDDEMQVLSKKYTMNLYMDVAQPQVPPTIVTLPLECPMKL